MHACRDNDAASVRQPGAGAGRQEARRSLKGTDCQIIKLLSADDDNPVWYICTVV